MSVSMDIEAAMRLARNTLEQGEYEDERVYTMTRLAEAVLAMEAERDALRRDVADLRLAAQSIVELRSPREMWNLCETGNEVEIAVAMNYATRGCVCWKPLDERDPSSWKRDPRRDVVTPAREGEKGAES